MPDSDAAAAAPMVRRVEQVMGMPISLALRGRYAGTAAGDHAWERAVAELRRLEAIFTTYRADSWIARLGRGEVAIADCPAEVATVLDLAEAARHDSGGAFDVWRVGRGYAGALDPSGVVKGWAVQQAFAAFADLDETDVCLSAGGDLQCRTRMPDSPGWRIGIEDPFAPDRVVAVVPIRDGAVATSGLAHRGAHITDPRDGSTPGLLASVTVVCADLTWADIDATAAFVLGDDARWWLESRGRAGLLVRSDGTQVVFGGIVG